MVDITSTICVPGDNIKFHKLLVATATSSVAFRLPDTGAESSARVRTFTSNQNEE